ncbi:MULTISPECIES: hypothetical protein [unclassified Frankia]
MMLSITYLLLHYVPLDAAIRGGRLHPPYSLKDHNQRNQYTTTY